MSGSVSPDAITLLASAIDEIRETVSLLPVADASRSLNRSWWRNVAALFARSGAEINAGYALQYLGENLDRAGTHWQEALFALAELQRLHHDNEVVAALGEELRGAGLNDVLARLHDDAIPRPTAKTAVYLAAVVETIRNCDHIALTARSRLTLQKMRNE